MSVVLSLRSPSGMGKGIAAAGPKSRYRREVAQNDAEKAEMAGRREQPAITGIPDMESEAAKR